MPLRLTYRGETTIPVEVEGLTPDWACGKSLAEIERWEILHGNRKLPLAELFAVSGDASDKRIEFEGDLRGVHWIGARMTGGAMHVAGSVGRHLGSGLRGGTIEVAGDADNWAGAEMTGGAIHIHGRAGDQLGCAYRGSPRGMSGGSILVDGDAGNEIGGTMRRGLIAVGGAAGDLAGFNMIAGTVLVFGDCGMRAGAGMRRGTVGLFGNACPILLPTFRSAGRVRPQVLSILLRDLRKRGFSFDDALLNSDFELHHGDQVALGRGEIFTRAK